MKLKRKLYIMPYNQLNKKNKYIKDFKRWVGGFYYKYISFEEYKKQYYHKNKK